MRAVRPFVTRQPSAIAARHRQLSRAWPHRMEDVGRIGKVRFINDSKATNADAAARALAVYPDIFWIAGGKAKEGGIESLAALFPAHPQGLSDRRSGACVRPHAGRQGRRMRFRGTLDARGASRRRRCRSVRRAARRSCCCRRPAPPTTSSRISSSAAMRSARWWRKLPRAAGAGGVMRSRAPTAAAFANWWFTVDRVALALHAGAGRGIGLMLAFAASPAITGGPLTAAISAMRRGRLLFAARRRRHSGRRVAALAAPDQDRGGRDLRLRPDRHRSWCCSWARDVLGARSSSISDCSRCSRRNSSSPASPSWPPPCWPTASRWRFPSR